MSRLAATLIDMGEAEQRVRTARWDAERIDRSIRAVDVLVEDIERLNLEDRSRVPLNWQPRLARMAAVLPVECGDRLRAGISPLRLLDQVYEIQQELLWIKQGEEADGFRSVDVQFEQAHTA
ncbi:MAG TPA: hypothetical protein VIA06_05245 [Candidatus Dormibacteraeota bacterium]|jgi:hypothetical protein|nr:hypothetical protein [Candidatus Dormibacteraeota bacterium]